MAKPTSLSSSSLVDELLYDVFLSFRGLDTRLGFTGHLNHALCERGVKTFMDNQQLEKGEEITSALMKGIEESRISMVIFSENYASSAFCLQELVTIMECHKHKSRLVWPVFYKVDPSDVRHQKGSYAEALAKHEKRISDKDKVEKWRLALQEAASLSGWHLENKSEIVFIQEIIEGVSKKINGSPLYVDKHLVGLNHEESLELVSWNAFGVKLVKTSCLKFPETKDLPLSLEKIGSSFSEKRLAADAYGINHPEEILRQTEKGEREKKEMREGKEKERSRSTGKERYPERQKSGERDWERKRSKSVSGDSVSGRNNRIGRFNVSESKSMGRDGVRGISNNMGKYEVRRRINTESKSRSNSRSNSHSRSKSRGRSNSRTNSKWGSHSRSNSRGSSNSRSNSKGTSNNMEKYEVRRRINTESKSRGRSNSRSNSHSRSKSRGRSNSRSKSRGRSNSRNNSHSRSKSRRRSNNRSNSRGRSHSRSNSRGSSNSKGRSNRSRKSNNKGREKKPLKNGEDEVRGSNRGRINRMEKR